jgi:hypothetical protein
MRFKESYKQSAIRYGENAAARELPPLPSLRIGVSRSSVHEIH